jgi:transposase
MVSKMEEPKGQKRARRSFTDEFKAGAVELVLDKGKTVAEAARDLDLTASALASWVKQARADRSKGKTGLTTAEREELARLRRENRELKMERDILKKPRPSSRRRASKVWSRRRGEGRVSSDHDVPRARRLAIGLLRLAEAPELGAHAS